MWKNTKKIEKILQNLKNYNIRKKRYKDILIYNIRKNAPKKSI